MDTLRDIEEALAHASRVPDDQRGIGWHSWVDGLLEKRKALAGTVEQSHKTRVVWFSEVQ